MSDGEDASMDTMEASGGHTLACGARAQPQANELLQGDDPVLVRGDLGDSDVDSARSTIGPSQFRTIDFVPHAQAKPAPRSAAPP
jgi:hypothetical protein